MKVHTLTMADEHWQAMERHVARDAPLEGCGMLAGKNGRVESVLPIHNEAQSPVRFRMDPLEQLNAFNWMDENGLDLVGIYHSHPTGPETASVSDIDEAAYDVVHIIWSQRNKTWNARGFWIEDGNASEVKLQVKD